MRGGRSDRWRDRRLGIQAVLEPASFTDARLRRAASAIVESVL